MLAKINDPKKGEFSVLKHSSIMGENMYVFFQKGQQVSSPS